MAAAAGGLVGTIIFSTVGRTQYGFDVFSLNIPPTLQLTTNAAANHGFLETCLTDGVSINFNAQFVQHGGGGGLVFVSERSGSPRLYLTPLPLPPGGGINHPILLSSPPPESLFLDRPIIKNQRLYFISAHHDPLLPFHSWSALYSTDLPLQDHDDDADNSNSKLVRRLTPHGSVDYSPSISQSGNFIAVASYGSRPWEGEFHQLNTHIVVFPVSDPTHRTFLCQHGGWPTWSGDSTIYFHRQDDDGWWSIFAIDFAPTTTTFTSSPPRRVTPSGHHCFTPAAMHNGRHIAVATRRPGNKFRHIEIFDVHSQTFYPVTELLNPNCHHYNPFVSPDSGSLGYHRFRGDSVPGDLVIPHLESVASPVKGLNMLRLNGSFPSLSPDRDLIAFNHGLDGSDSGVKILKSDGSRRCSVLKGRTAFCNSWSPTEKNVIFTSLGPIFESVKATVQIARISFPKPDNLLVSGDSEEEIPGGVHVKVLTQEDTGNNAFPSCSPDGKFVVFRSGRSGHKNLYIVDAVDGEFGGGGIRQLTEGACIDTMPNWSPDGKLIAFSSNRHNPEDVAAFSIYVIHPDGTGLRRIAVAGDEEQVINRERINHVCFSADGEWLLFTANLGGVTAEPVSLPNQFQPYGDLYVIKLDGTGLQRLTWNGYENGTPTWHPDVWDVVSSSSSSLSSEGRLVGDKLKGDFDEPLWIH